MEAGRFRSHPVWIALVVGLATDAAGLPIRFGDPLPIEYGPPSGRQIREAIVTPDGPVVFDEDATGGLLSSATSDLLIIHNAGPELVASFPRIYTPTLAHNEVVPCLPWVDHGGGVFAFSYKYSFVSIGPSDNRRSLELLDTQGQAYPLHDNQLRQTSPYTIQVNTRSNPWIGSDGKPGLSMNTSRSGRLLHSDVSLGWIFNGRTGYESVGSTALDGSWLSRAAATFDEKLGEVRFVFPEQDRLVVANDLGDGPRHDAGPEPDSFAVRSLGSSDGTMVFATWEASGGSEHGAAFYVVTESSFLRYVPAGIDSDSEPFPVLSTDEGFHTLWGGQFPSTDIEYYGLAGPLNGAVLVDIASEEPPVVTNMSELIGSEVHQIHFDLLSSTDPRYAAITRAEGAPDEIHYLYRGSGEWTSQLVHSVDPPLRAEFARAGRDGLRAGVAWMEVDEAAGLRFARYSMALETEFSPGQVWAIR